MATWWHSLKRRVLAFAAVLAVVAGTILIANRLRQIEAEEAVRDTWQKPDKIVAALNLHPGSIVADLASGSGYFTFKVAAATGSQGKTIANDIRRRPLLMVSLRSILKGASNVQTVLGDYDDPHLPEAAIDGILVFNAFHEFTEPEKMLDHMVASLRPNGRIVIVDRHPPKGHANDGIAQDDHHHMPISRVTEPLKARGLEIVIRDEDLIHLQDEAKDIWWMVAAARK
jgi:SAM-dependent methyltransferase